MTTHDHDVSTAVRQPWYTREPLLVLALVLVTLVHAVVTIRDVSGPMIAGDDRNLYEYLSYFVHDHLRFAPLPTLDFVTDEVGYPYGTSVVYMSWCAERDLLHSLMLTLFGPGPWNQLHVGAGDFVAALGTYVLLRREVGPWRAALVGFAATTMAFYTAFKFQSHVNLAAHHWATLSIVLDFVIVRRIVRGERLDALTLLMRAALLTLTVGLDIAYVAGFALTSFTISTCFLIAWLVKEERARKSGSASAFRRLVPQAIGTEIGRRPWVFAAWAVLLLVGLLLYVPLDLAIVRGSRIYEFKGVQGVFWSSQFRMLLPYFPFLNPGSAVVGQVFGEPEGLGEFSIGWALLGAAVLGVRDARRGKRLTAFVPVLVTFVLCLAFHPTRMPTLRIFPWFLFNRVAGRGSLFLPLFAALLALGIDTVRTRTTEPGEVSNDATASGAPPKRATRETRPVFAWILGLLALVETVTAYAVVGAYRPIPLDSSVREYLEFVRAAPGTALLDWPFCIAGGNGVGTAELCPYYARNATVFAYRRFHQKKLPSFYLARVHEKQIAPWKAAGWPAMFSPDEPNPHTAHHQTRCFDDRDWAFFTAFYEGGDFSGIQLYPDLEAPACLEGFYARFGRPAKETVLPNVGRVQFLLRDAASRSRVDPERAVRLVR